MKRKAGKDPRITRIAANGKEGKELELIRVDSRRLADEKERPGRIRE
jgi:hypothetical protein